MRRFLLVFVVLFFATSCQNFSSRSVTAEVTANSLFYNYTRKTLIIAPLELKNDIMTTKMNILWNYVFSEIYNMDVENKRPNYMFTWGMTQKIIPELYAFNKTFYGSIHNVAGMYEAENKGKKLIDYPEVYQLIISFDFTISDDELYLYLIRILSQIPLFQDYKGKFVCTGVGDAASCTRLN